MTTTRSNRTARGFTLIELLVTISVIAVMLGILIATLAKTRVFTSRTQSLANLRSLGVTIELYASNNDSRFPYYEPGVPLHVVPPFQDESNGISMSTVWNIDKMWPTLMHEVAPWEEHLQSWYSPGRRHEGFPNVIPMVIGVGSIGPVSYHYSNSFIASPRVWNGVGDATEDDIGPISMTAVAHPSSKVIMLDFDRAYLPRQTLRDSRPLLFADGSASSRLDSEANPPVANPLYFNTSRIYHCTPDGVLGRDF